MTIFRILKDDDENLIGAMPLSPGEHFLEHGGARVTVRVGKDDSVTVFLRSYDGDPEDLYLAGVEGDSAERRMLLDGRIREVKIETPHGDSAVGLLGVNQSLDTQLALTRLSDAPALGARARR